MDWEYLAMCVLIVGGLAVFFCLSAFALTWCLDGLIRHVRDTWKGE